MAIKVFGREVSRKNRHLVAPVAAITTIVVLSFLVVRPAVGQVLRLRAENAAQAKKLSQIEGKVTTLESLDQERLKQQVSLAAAALPAEKDVIQPLFTLGQLALDNTLLIESLQVAPGGLATESAEAEEEEAPEVTFEQPTLRFRLVLIGSWEGAKNFLAAVNRMLPLMRVEKASLAKLEERELQELETVSGDHKLQLDLLTFFAPYPTSLGRPEIPLNGLTGEEEVDLARLQDFEKKSPGPLPPGVGEGRVNPFSL